jgi:HEAT repeat protein
MEQIRSPRESGTQWALIVHYGESADAPASGLAKILVDTYGYREEHVLVLEGQSATTGSAIRDAMSRIRSRLQLFDNLLVHLSLPTSIELDGAIFFPSDGELSNPWTLLRLHELVEWLNSLPTGTALLSYYSCSSSEGADFEKPLFDELRYSKRPGPIEILRVCDFTAETQSAARERRPTPSDVRRSELLSNLNQTLAAASVSDTTFLSGEQLARRLDAQKNGFYTRYGIVPEHERLQFAFVVTGVALEKYRRSFTEAHTQQQRESTVIALVEAVNAAEGEFPASAVSFLEGIALARQSTTSIPLEPRERLSLSGLAVDGLGRIRSAAATSSLVRISADASEASIRQAAIATLSTLPASEDFQVKTSAIRRALGDPDASVREAAIRGTVLLRDIDAADALAGLVSRDSNLTVRRAAIQGLSVFGREKDRRMLVRLLRDPETDIRREAATALARLGPAPSVAGNLLERLEQDEDDSVRASAALALGRTFREEERSQVEQGLRSAIRRGPTSVREAAVRSLGNIGGRHAEEELRLVLVGTSDDSVLVAAAEGLGQLRSTVAVPELQRAATAQSPGLRRAAVSALGAIGSRDTVPFLLQMLDDEDPYVRLEAKKGLDQFEDPNVDAFVQGLTHPSPRVRHESVMKIAASKDPGAIDALIGALDDEDGSVREAAVRGLGQFPPEETVEGLSRTLRRGSNILMRQGAAAALAQQSGDEVVAALETGLNDPSGTVRAEVTRSLGNHLGTSSLEALLRAAKDADPLVRTAAATSLGMRDDPRARQLLEVLAKEDPAPDVRKAAIQSLTTKR